MGVAQGRRRHAAVHGARGAADAGARRARRSVLARRARLLPADRAPRVLRRAGSSELRDVWRSRPQPPARLVADVPPALSALVMQLLALDRSAPAAERGRGDGAAVRDRRAPARGADAEVSRAYLTTPDAGRPRASALVAVRRRMLALVRGDGGALLIEGAPGSGRSRLLDACVLEAKLLGAAVLRADAGDGAGGDWGVARALGAQLLELMPEQAASGRASLARRARPRASTSCRTRRHGTATGRDARAQPARARAARLRARARAARSGC